MESLTLLRHRQVLTATIKRHKPAFAGLHFYLINLFRQKRPEVSAEHLARIAGDLALFDPPAGVEDVGIFFEQHVRDDLFGMDPFIEHLVNDAAVRMLRDEARAEQLEAHAGHFFDKAWGV